MAQEAFEFGDVFPIWGTCLGFELLATFTNGGQPILTSCDSQNQALPLNVTMAFDESKIGSTMPSDVRTTLTTGKILSMTT